MKSREFKTKSLKKPVSAQVLTTTYIDADVRVSKKALKKQREAELARSEMGRSTVNPGRATRLLEKKLKKKEEKPSSHISLNELVIRAGKVEGNIKSSKGTVTEDETAKFRKKSKVSKSELPLSRADIIKRDYTDAEIKENDELYRIVYGETVQVVGKKYANSMHDAVNKAKTKEFVDRQLRANYSKIDKKKNISRERVFEEVSQSLIDANLKKQTYKGGHAPRAGRRQHPDAIRQQRAKERKAAERLANSAPKKLVTPEQLAKYTERNRLKNKPDPVIRTESGQLDKCVCIEPECRERLREFGIVFVDKTSGKPIPTESRMDKINPDCFRAAMYVGADVFGSYIINEIFGDLINMNDVIGWTTMCLDVTAFVYMLSKASSKTEIAVLSYQFVRLLGLDGTLKSVIARVDEFIGFSERILKLLRGPVVDEGHIKSESASAKMETMKSFCSQILSGEVVGAIRDFIVALAGFKFFNKDIAFSIYSILGKPASMDVLSLFDLITDSVIKMCRYGEMLADGKSVKDVLMSDSPLVEFSQKSLDLLSYKEKLYNGVACKGRMCYKEFLMRAEKLLKAGKEVIERSSPRTRCYIEANKVVRMLESAILMVEEQYCGNRNRIPPIGVLLHGDPGIGKSKLLPFIANVYARVRGRSFDESHIYPRVMTSQYWEGYVPNSHPYIHYSEIGNKAEGLVKTAGDDAVSELTSLIDSLPFSPDMAFEGKGKVFANPDLVLADTNSPDLNLRVLVKNPAAYQRRFIYIEPVVKPEFRAGQSCSIDIKKSLEHDSDIMDRWYFKVYKFIPHGVVDSHKEYLLNGGQDDNIYALGRVLYEEFAKHVEKNDSVEAMLNDYTGYDRYIPQLWGVVEQDPIPAQSGSLFVYENINIEVSHIDHFKNAAEYCWQSFFALLVLLWHVFIEILGSTDPKISWIRVTVLLTMWFFIYSVCRNYWWDSLLITVLLSNVTLLFAIGCTNVPGYAMRLYGWVSLPGKVKKSYAVLMHKVFDKHHDWIRQSCWWIAYGAGILAAAKVIHLAIQRIREELSIPVYVPSEASEFKLTSMINEDLSEIEERIEAKHGRSRVPVQGTMVWNTVINPTTPTIHKGSPVSLDVAVGQNVRKTKIDNQEYLHLVGLKGNYAMISTHAFMGRDTNLLEVSHTGVVKSQYNHTFATTKIVKGVNRIDLGEDVSIIRLNSLIFKDITKHLSEDEWLKPDSKGFPSYGGSFRQTGLQTVISVGEKTFVNPHIGQYEIGCVMQYRDPDHKAGDCGLPLILQKTSGSCIFGIHTGGHEDFGYAVCVRKSMVDTAIATLEGTSLLPVQSEGSYTKFQFAGAVGTRSPFRFMPIHGFPYYGKLEGEVMVRNKSGVKKTPLFISAPDLFKVELDFDRTTYFGPPMMQPQWVHDKYVSPWNNALEKMNAQKAALDDRILERCVSRYVEYITSRLGDVKLAPLPLMEAINGVSNDPFTRRINVKTAAGFPYSGTKEDFLPVVQEDELNLIREPVEVIKEDVAKIFACYDNDENYQFVYNASLKDEPRDEDKIWKGKTRVFFASALTELIVARMMLSPFYTTMVEKGDAFCSAVGLNAFNGADPLVARYKEFSDLLMEGDYGAYDQTNPFQIGQAAGAVVYRVLEHCGYNEKALKYVRGIFSDSLYPFVNMNKDLMCVPGLQPSGKYATAEDNSIRGVLLLMYAWYSNPILADKDFFEFILPLVYGDDMLASVKPAVKELYNNHTYRDFCKTDYHMEFTPANKSGEMSKFVPWDAATFLKRRFKWREDLNHWVMPLDMNSMLKSLCWTIRSEVVSPDIQMHGTICSVLWELVFHVDKDKHEIMRVSLADQYNTHFAYRGLNSFPTYEEIVERLWPSQQ